MRGRRRYFLVWPCRLGRRSRFTGVEGDGVCRGNVYLCVLRVGLIKSLECRGPACFEVNNICMNIEVDDRSPCGSWLPCLYISFSTKNHSSRGDSSAFRIIHVKKRMASMKPSARRATGAQCQQIKHTVLLGGEHTFVDGMSAIERVGRVDVPITEDMFGQLPVVLRICMTC